MPTCHIYNTRGDELARFSTEELGWTITIGRSSKCDICLKGYAENNVSREHIYLHKVGSKWQLDSKGHSGVYLNGDKIESAPLEEGMVFRFSQLFLCVGEKCGPSQFDLVWEAATENNQHRAVIWPGVNTVGASRDNYITVRTDDVSRMHGKITETDGRLFYENLYSSVDSELNGIKVTEKVEFNENDILSLALTDVHAVRAMRKGSDNMLEASGKATITGRNYKNGAGSKMAFIIIVVLLVLLFILFANIIYHLLMI